MTFKKSTLVGLNSMPSNYYSSYTVTGSNSVLPTVTVSAFMISSNVLSSTTVGTTYLGYKDNPYANYPNAVINVPLGSTITEQLSTTCTHSLDGTYSKASITTSPTLNVIGDALGIGKIGIVSDSSKHSVIYVNVVIPQWTSLANATIYSIYAGLINKITL